MIHHSAQNTEFHRHDCHLKLLTISFFASMCIASSAPCQTYSPLTEIVVEAFVDGPSTLHITQTGIYWTNGSAAKPGRFGAKNYPTYVNRKEWIPQWTKNGDDRGEDRSDTYKIKLPFSEYHFEILAISDQKDGSRKHKRTLPHLERRSGELCVDIPDPEPGAKWYRFRLKPTKKQ